MGYFVQYLSNKPGRRPTKVPFVVMRHIITSHCIFQAGEKYWGTNEAEIQRILAIRSYTHLQRTFEEYDKVYIMDVHPEVLNFQISN